MDAKFYIKNLTNSSKQNSGEGNQIETDPIKRYLNELATKTIEKGTSYIDILSFNDPSPIILDKPAYINFIGNAPDNINLEKIGDESNYEFVIIEVPDNILEIDGEALQNSKFIFVNEENGKYFLNKFIKASTKQFIKSVLYTMMQDVISDDINSKNFEEKIAINNLKFAINLNQEGSNLTVIDDIDLKAFYQLIENGWLRCIFDENENKIIFNIRDDVYGEHTEYVHILFIFSNDPLNKIVTENINGTNYKILQPGDISH